MGTDRARNPGHDPGQNGHEPGERARRRAAPAPTVRSVKTLKKKNEGASVSTLFFLGVFLGVHILRKV